MASSRSTSKNESAEKNISSWLKRETLPIRNALETASKHFDKDDAFDVHTLEAVYAQESSFGQSRGKRNSAKAAGDFQIKRATAKEIGLRVNNSVDERFDVNHASAASAKLLKRSDSYFEKAKRLDKNLKITAVKEPDERKKFVLAAYNAGDSRIARAQLIAKRNNEDPTKWYVVQKYLEEAGATEAQADETRDYVEKIIGFEGEFVKRSKADPAVKMEKSKDVSTGSHWVTINGRHILIKDE